MSRITPASHAAPAGSTAPPAASVFAVALSGLIVGSIFFDLDLDDANAKFGVSLMHDFLHLGRESCFISIRPFVSRARSFDVLEPTTGTTT